MEQKRVLIADSQQGFAQALANLLRPQFDVRLAHNGFDVWQQLEAFVPEVLVLDLILPGLDGISLLQRCASENIRPTTLAVTRLCTDFVISSLTELGVSYILPKPCQPENAANCIAQMCRMPAPSEAATLQPDTPHLLRQLGVSGKLTGSRYLGCAVPLFSQNPDQMLTKELYGTVAQHFHASAAQVERSIRTAIHSAWLTRDERVWRRFFPTGEGGTVRRPTNGEFISRLAQVHRDTASPGKNLKIL